jgi:diguanylate cyclase (GGDEF)-like protein
LVGDAVLHKIAKLISENLREIDFVARYGGEEFSVVLLDTDKSDAIMVAERICAKISHNRIRAFDETLDVTVSLGVATYPANTLYPDMLLETADKALYKAKTSGKNRACWF